MYEIKRPVFAVVIASLLWATNGWAEDWSQRPAGRSGELFGVYFPIPNEPSPLLTCPAGALGKQAFVGTWRSVDGVCDDFAPGADCAGRFHLYQETCNFFSDGATSLFSFVDVGKSRTCLDEASGFACGAPGANVVSTAIVRARGRVLGAADGSLGPFHSVSEADQAHAPPFWFEGELIKVKKQSFTCHTFSAPDPGLNGCDGNGCESDAFCVYSAKGRRAH